MAQAIGLICREFGYRLDEVLKLPVSQIHFLLAWLDWWRSKTG